MVNTFRAHQLLYWAEGLDLQTALNMSLFRAFFSQQQDVSDIRVLVDCADSVGLDADEAAAVLDDGRYADTVRDAQRYWQERDVYAVPTFFLQQQYQVAGAQEAESLVRVLHKIRNRHLQKVVEP